jgi:hypothetical protein
MAHNGGGEFRVVVQPGFSPQVALAQEAITQQTAALNNQTIDTYMKAKGIDLDDATLRKIRHMRFDEIEDPKVRVALHEGEPLEHRVNGLTAISTSSPIEINAGAPNKAWTPGHALGYMKDDLEIATESFRCNAILEAHGLESAAPHLEDCHSELTHNRDSLHECFTTVVQKTEADSKNDKALPPSPVNPHATPPKDMGEP